MARKMKKYGSASGSGAGKLTMKKGGASKKIAGGKAFTEFNTRAFSKG
jgi:hypothetical protein